MIKLQHDIFARMCKDNWQCQSFLNIMEQLIIHNKENCDVNQILTLSDSKIGTTMYLAATRGNLSMMKMLDKRGFAWKKLVNENINFFGHARYECCILLVLCDEGHIECLKYLFERSRLRRCDIDINVTNHEGMNSLHLSTRKYHDEIVQYLLENVYNVYKNFVNNINLIESEQDICKEYGITPVHIVCKGFDTRRGLYQNDNIHQLKSFQYLVEIGSADMNISDSYGYLPIHIACEHNQFQILNYMLEKRLYSDINIETRMKENGYTSRLTPLMVAVFHYCVIF